jgi:hypothetical protein
MFSKTVDVVVETYLADVIENKIIEKATQPLAFKGIKQQTTCPFSRFASKFTKPTIKSCDGVNALFEKSLIIKAPSEFYLKSEDATFQSQSPSRLYDIQYHQHDEIQVTPFKFYPKIMFPAFVQAKEDMQFLIHKAHYHSKNSRVYPSGIIKGSFCPNIIFELEKNTEDFIEYLEPLLYLTVMTDKKIKVHYELITEQEFNRKKLKFERRKFSRHTVLEE